MRLGRRRWGLPTRCRAMVRVRDAATRRLAVVPWYPPTRCQALFEPVLRPLPLAHAVPVAAIQLVTAYRGRDAAVTRP